MSLAVIAGPISRRPRLARSRPCLSNCFGNRLTRCGNAVRLLTNAHIGAPPATGKFPVAVFNHGYLSYAAQHTALFEHLAANGYVVLSVGHPWESGGIVYPNGDAVLGSPRILDDMMRIGQALGAMAAYAAPTLAAQLGALREYIRVLRTTSAGRLAPVWRDDVYSCSTGSRRIRFQPLPRCRR
jgi:predicted dienelactone hydrolase